jgi:hypothetical protein
MPTETSTKLYVHEFGFWLGHIFLAHGDFYLPRRLLVEGDRGMGKGEDRKTNFM